MHGLMLSLHNVSRAACAHCISRYTCIHAEKMSRALVISRTELLTPEEKLRTYILIHHRDHTLSSIDVTTWCEEARAQHVASLNRIGDIIHAKLISY